MKFISATTCTMLWALLVTTAVECRAVPSDDTLARQGVEDLFIPKRPIPYSLLGVNAFVNDPRFGSIRNQFRDVKGSLRLRRVRVLFAWNDQIQPTPSSEPFFGFYDEIVRSLPIGVEAVAVLTGIPSWVNDPKNWVNGDPRATFVELWVRKVISRYRRRGRVAAYQIWNEPNNPDFDENRTLDLLTNPGNYVDLVARARTTIKSIAPLEYAQRIFAFLKSNVPSIRRIYWYQFTEGAPAESTYGLRNLSPGAFLSDLYVNLRDRQRGAPAR